MPTRRKTLAALLPEPDSDQWAVCLHLADEASDKEYRIVVDGAETLFQWGRRGQGGQTQHRTHKDAGAAHEAAVSRWAAKEAKGYWPTTGIMELTGSRLLETVRAGQVASALMWRAAELVAELSGARAGRQLWLCQTPPADAPVDATGPLQRLAASTGGGRRAASRGGYVAVAVTAATEPALRGLCPVAVKLGSAGDTQARLVANLAAGLSSEIVTVDSARETLAEAVAAARALI